MRNFITSLKELLFPPVCLVCNTHMHDIQEMHLCQHCLAGFRFIVPPFCSACGERFVSREGTNHLCSTCLATPFSFSKARSLVSYNDHAARLIHSFKYGKRTAALSTFNAFWEKSGLKQEFSDIDLVVPVPLHLERLRWRGYNQALLLAELFFQDQKKKVDPFLLIRIKNTPPQTGLSGRDRRKNLSGAFAVVHPESISSKKILLVDDVFTTGTTLSECAQSLMSLGALSVQALTLAKVPVHS